VSLQHSYFLMGIEPVLVYSSHGRELGVTHTHHSSVYAIDLSKTQEEENAGLLCLE